MRVSRVAHRNWQSPLKDRLISKHPAVRIQFKIEIILWPEMNKLMVIRESGSAEAQPDW
jgi:hypothetical protein